MYVKLAGAAQSILKLLTRGSGGNLPQDRFRFEGAEEKR